jgi:hypothetical protein
VSPRLLDRSFLWHPQRDSNPCRHLETSARAHDRWPAGLHALVQAGTGGQLDGAKTDRSVLASCTLSPTSWRATACVRSRAIRSSSSHSGFRGSSVTTEHHRWPAGAGRAIRGWDVRHCRNRHCRVENRAGVDLGPLICGRWGCTRPRAGPRLSVSRSCNAWRTQASKTSPPEINAWFDQWNTDPKLFTSHRSADEILTKLAKDCTALTGNEFEDAPT